MSGKITIKFTEAPNLKNLVTAKDQKSTPIYSWYTFSHAYSPFIIDYLIEYSKLEKKDGKIFDMFLGSGTTLRRAKELGISGGGIDLLPVSIQVTTAKISNYSVKKLKILNKKLKNLDLEGDLISDISIIKKVFHADSFSLLANLSNFIKDLSEPYRSFFMTALLKTSERIAGSIKSGGFSRNRETTKNTHERLFPPEKGTLKEVLPTFFTITDSMIAEYENDATKNNTEFSVQEGDAREIPEEDKYRWVITSPPYPNRQDYTRIFETELALGHSLSSEDHKTLRSKTFRSHLEAKSPKKILSDFVPPRGLIESIEKIIEEMEASKSEKRTADSRLPKMLLGYFEDIFLMFESLKKSLEKNSKIFLVVSNVKHMGIQIEVDRMIAEIAIGCGYTCNEILIARYRGNSSQQMGRYSRTLSRESVVVLSSPG